ncbi:hypothetical protein VTK73DRAFT_5381 [Phialemonium thermophilum]|uniref:Uncharacterized protein n=1 Tax=Phialemonium thermophilum TaxID=223376 RepID=A0ABR3XX51_9PEZI
MVETQFGLGTEHVSTTDFERINVADESSTASRNWSFRSPVRMMRSLSDSEGTPKLSPSPHIRTATVRQSKDDNSIPDGSCEPSTPNHTSSNRDLALQLPERDAGIHGSHPYAQGKHGPLSPKLEHQYPSPTNILPRRSRGLDFSRAATSLHHSTLADQGSPSSSPTVASRAVNIPGRRSGDYGNTEQSSNSLWSMMGGPERSTITGSLGSTLPICSSSSSSSDDDDLMDEDMDEAFLTTPHVSKVDTPMAISSAPWIPGVPHDISSLPSFQQRQRPRRQPRHKARGASGAGFNPSMGQSILSRSPPNPTVTKEPASVHARRESISWAANQLHISGSESDENLRSQNETVDSPSRPSVIKRAVTRRGNLLPKTKGFARIRAALAEETAPIEAEVRREAEVVRQVRDSDLSLEPRTSSKISPRTTAPSSPSLPAEEFSEGPDVLDDISEDAMVMDTGLPGAAGLGLSGSFKQRALKNSKGKIFWDSFPDSTGRNRDPSRASTPPPLLGMPRGSVCSLNLEDISMDSPSTSSNGTGGNSSALPPPATSSNSGHHTPQPGTGQASGEIMAAAGAGTGPPSAAEITKRINGKRRRDDDFDPMSFKRRAVSPGISVHNSPIMQSPLQRDMASWGSRPGSVGGDTTARQGSGSNAPSETGSQTGAGGAGGNAPGRAPGNKGRIGFQGMIDTNDGITRLSIE